MALFRATSARKDLTFRAFPAQQAEAPLDASSSLAVELTLAPAGDPAGAGASALDFRVLIRLSVRTRTRVCYHVGEPMLSWP